MFMIVYRDKINLLFSYNISGWFYLEGCISCYQEKRNKKVESMHSIMANLNIGQDVANKREKK